MPESFAEGYIRGILGGYGAQRTQQQIKLGEIRNRLLEEEIADMQEGRKRRKSLLTLMSKLDPTLQESILMKEGFPGMPFEATPYGQEQKRIAESTPEKVMEKREAQANLRTEAGREALPGIMGAWGKERFVEKVGKPQLGMDVLEEMGVVPKREKATTPRALTDNEKLAHYRIKIEKGTATEAEKNFVEQKGYDRETGKKVEKEGDEFAFRKTAQWKDIYGLVKQEIMREKRKPLSVEDIAEAEKQADKYYRDLLETSGSSEYSKYFID